MCLKYATQDVVHENVFKSIKKTIIYILLSHSFLKHETILLMNDMGRKNSQKEL